MSIKMFKRDSKVRILPIFALFFALIFKFEYWSASTLKKDTFSILNDGVLRTKIGLYLALIITMNYRATQGEYFVEKKKKMHMFLRSIGFNQLHINLTYISFNFLFDFLVVSIYFNIMRTSCQSDFSILLLLLLTFIAMLANSIFNLVFSQFFSDENISTNLLNIILFGMLGLVAFAVESRNFIIIGYIHPSGMILDFIMNKFYNQKHETNINFISLVIGLQCFGYTVLLLIIQKLNRPGLGSSSGKEKASNDRHNDLPTGSSNNMSLESKLTEDLAQPMVSIKDIKKSFGSNTVLEGVNLDIGKGEILCLLGANGAGKSTLFNIILQEEEPSSGHIIKLQKDKPIAFCPQQDMGWDFITIEEHIAFVRDVQKSQGKWTSINEEYLAKIQDICQLQDHLKVNFKALSGGFKRRLTIAMSLLCNPEMVLMDEPTTALDMEIRHSIMMGIFRLRDELGTTILFTTHHLEDAENFSDRVALLSKGKVILDGTMHQMRERFNTVTLTVRMTEELKQEEAIAYCREEFKGVKMIEDLPSNKIDIQQAYSESSEILITQMKHLEENLGCEVELKQLSLEDFYLMDGDLQNTDFMNTLGKVDMDKCWQRLLECPRNLSPLEAFIQIYRRSKIF